MFVQYLLRIIFRNKLLLHVNRCAFLCKWESTVSSLQQFYGKCWSSLKLNSVCDFTQANGYIVHSVQCMYSEVWSVTRTTDLQISCSNITTFQLHQTTCCQLCAFLWQISFKMLKNENHSNYLVTMLCNVLDLFFSVLPIFCYLLEPVVVVCIYRVLVKSSRKLAQQYRMTYTEEIPTAQLVQRIANVMQEYTQQG